MQYGRLRRGSTKNVEQTAASLGMLLVHEFEQKGISTELPTDADWGYTFRIKIEKQNIDVSLVDHDEDGFGIALEAPKYFFNVFMGHKHSRAIESAKSFLAEALDKIVTNSTLVWYTKSEWLETFDTDFWQQRN